jgi:uncharacterized membrane protein YqjE
MAEQQARTAPPADESTPELMSRLTDQTTRLVRHEIALAKVELSEKAKNAGVGAGAFSAAAVLALYAVGTLIATAVLALAEVMDAWLAALVVAVVVLALAGIAALVGKQRVGRAGPPLPEEAMESVKRDIAEVKEARHRDN